MVNTHSLSPKEFIALVLLGILLSLALAPSLVYAAANPGDYGAWGSPQFGEEYDWEKKRNEAIDIGTGIIAELLKRFESATSTWIAKLKPLAEKLLMLFAIFEVCWLGIRLALGQANPAEAIKQFVMFILMAGFFLAVIHNYDTWSDNIIQGLTGTNGVGVSLGAPAASAETAFRVGLTLTFNLWKKLSGFSPIEGLGLIIIGLVLIISFGLITARIVLIKCEAFVSLAAALLLVGFGGSSMTKDYAVGAIRYVLTVAMKLFTLQLIMFTGVEIIMLIAPPDMSFTIGETIVVVCAVIVLLALVFALPEIIAGIMNGAQIGSSGAGLGAASGAVTGAVAGGAAVAVGGPMAAVGGMKSVSAASKIADMAGVTGLGKMAHMGRNMLSAGSEAKSRGSGSSRSSIMKERLAAAMQPQNRDA